MKKYTPYIIGIAGPSGAGKTELSYLTKKHSHLFTYLGADNYFKSPETFPKKFGLPNWEVPGNIDFKKLVSDIRLLKNGKSINIETLPIETRSGIKRYKLRIRPNKFIIVDGFMIFKNRILRDMLDLKIYMHIPKKIMLERRRLQFGRITDYDKKIAIPEFIKRGLDQIKFADYVFNGSVTLQQNRKFLIEILQGAKAHRFEMGEKDIITAIQTGKFNSLDKKGIKVAT